MTQSEKEVSLWFRDHRVVGSAITACQHVPDIIIILKGLLTWPTQSTKLMATYNLLGGIADVVGHWYPEASLNL